MCAVPERVLQPTHLRIWSIIFLVQIVSVAQPFKSLVQTNDIMLMDTRNGLNMGGVVKNIYGIKDQWFANGHRLFSTLSSYRMIGWQQVMSI